MLFTSPWPEVSRLAFLGKQTQVWFCNTLTTLFHVWENGRHGAEQLSPGKHLEPQGGSLGLGRSSRPLCLHVMLHNLCCGHHNGILSAGVLCAACCVHVVSKAHGHQRRERWLPPHCPRSAHEESKALEVKWPAQDPKLVGEKARVWMCSLWAVPWDLWECLGQQILKTLCSIYQVFSPTRTKTSGISRSPGHVCFCLIETNSGRSWGSEG